MHIDLAGFIGCILALVNFLVLCGVVVFCLFIPGGLVDPMIRKVKPFAAMVKIFIAPGFMGFAASRASY